MFKNPFKPTPEYKVPEPVAPVRPEWHTPTADDNDGYTIGSKDGRTVFKITSGYTTITLTLAPSEVHRMIRLLEASLDEDVEEDTEAPTQDAQGS